VGSAINTSDPTNWPVQTYVVDNISGLYKSDSMSQYSLNGLNTVVTIQRAGTLADVSAFKRCSLPMLNTTYRIWTITSQPEGYPSVTNQVVVPDADGQYIWPVQAMAVFTEFLDHPGGAFTVQYWNVNFMTQSNPVWTPIKSFTTTYQYDGNGIDFGEHVVTVNGQDRIEISNVPGTTYLPGNVPFSISPP
jgi:hypothetical protein